MPSTYTLNNGIELIGTGEQSGTWGDTTNTNLDLLDAALDGQVTITLGAAGSSGSPNALPITDGTASNGRNRMVVFADSGDLGATAYVQLTPNDAEKIIYIRNSLSGSRSVILFQGTYNASNDYEVPAGTTAVVYFDGAGAGAVAANVFNNAYFDGLRLGSVSVTAILDEDNMASDSATALATQQSIKAYVDSQVGTVDTLAEILAIGNTTGATDIAVDSAQKVQFRDAAIYINSSVDGQLDIVADTEIQIAATTVDVNGALDVSGTALVTGVLTTTAATVFNGGFAAGGVGTFADGSNSAPSLTNTGDLNTGLYFPAADEVGLTVGGTQRLNVSATGIDVTGTVVADGLTVDTDVYRRLLLTYPDAFTSKLQVGFSNFYVQGSSTNDRLTIANNSSGQTHFENQSKTSMVIDNSGDISFYEDTGTTAKFFWDASAESLGIGTSPTSKLQIGGMAAGEQALLIESARNDALSNGLVRINITDIVCPFAGLQIDHAGTGAAIIANGNVGIGTSSPSFPLSIQSNSSAEALLILGRSADDIGEIAFRENDNSTALGELQYRQDHAILRHRVGDLRFATGGTLERMRIDSSGNVGIGTSSPATKLHLASAANTGLLVSSTDGTTFKGIAFNTSDNQFTVGTQTNHPFVLYTNNTERMRITSTGSVGIGTSSPSGELDVTFSKASAVTNLYVRNPDNSGGAAIRVQSQTDAHQVILGITDAGSGGRVGTLTNDDFYFVTNNTERLRIDTSGNVGIGTSSVAARLEVASPASTPAVLRISSNKTGTGSGDRDRLEFYSADNSGTAYQLGYMDYDRADGTGTASYIAWASRVAGTVAERMRIDSSGNVLVGTSSQIGSEKFGILTTGTGVFAHWKSTGTSGNPQVFRISTGQLSGGIGSGRFITCDDGGSDKFFVTGAGVVNAASATITTISDQRLKENIRDLDDGLEKVLALKPRKFDWKENKGENIKNARGFIAQELELVFPDMISNWTDEPPEGEEPYKAVNANLIPTLVKAIQEQQAIITALETRLSALEG
jgi:hypothetical protein